VVPLVTLPYVARVVEPSAFGLIAFSQGFSFVLVVFIDWGFSYTGIRSTAENQADPRYLTDIVRRVRGAQLLLAAASLAIALGALAFVPPMLHHPEFLALAWIAAAATGLTPGWFFVGTEEPRRIALIQIAFRVLGAVLTFVFVKGPGDAWIVMALFTASAIAGWIASDILMYRRIEFRRPDVRGSIAEIRKAATIFVGTIGATLYTSFNVVLLGLFEPSASVAHFGAAERVVRMSLTMLGPIGIAVFPRLVALQTAGSRARARSLMKVMVVVVAVPALLLTIALVVLAPVVIRIIYGHRFVDASVPILRVLVLIVPLGMTAVIFGTWLVTQHRDRDAVLVVLRAGVVNVVLGCVLTPAFGPIGMAWSVVAAETTAALGAILAVKRGGGAKPAPAVAAHSELEPVGVNER